MLFIRTTLFLVLVALCQADKPWCNVNTPESYCLCEWCTTDSYPYTGYCAEECWTASTEAETDIGRMRFAGSYADPNHPDCLRMVSFTDSTDYGTYKVYGTDAARGEGVACGGKGGDDILWGPLPGTIDANNRVNVDFSSKGGPSLSGVFNGTFADGNLGIYWDDGNVWHKTTIISTK
mgnify:CR=1 FL=1